MNDVLPSFLFRSKRGICPTCGSAVALAGAGVQVKCTYCGGQSMLERRLRKVDSDLDLPELEGGDERKSDTRVLARALGAKQFERVTCPGCGQSFEGDTSHTILRCDACGTQSKVERRMVRAGGEERKAPQRRTHADFQAQRRGKSKLHLDVQTEQLCWRVLNEKDPLKQIALARNFESWGYINATLVYFLPHLLALAKKSDLRLAHPIFDGVGKLLCQDDARLFAPTLETCEPFTLDFNGSTEILHEIGLGNARGMKQLIDAADVASRAGRLDYAANALWAAHGIIERNFDQHPVIAEIMLYRLFYLSPLVLGWALNEMQSGYGGYVFKDARKLLEFIDDCAFERPDLVPHLARCVRGPWLKTEPELAGNLQFIGSLKSKPARAAALDALANLDEEAPDAAFETGVKFIEPWLDDSALLEAATGVLRRYVKNGKTFRPAVLALILRRKESLPDILQREVHWKQPDNRLLDRSKIPPFYNPPPEPGPPEVVTRALAAYDSAIREAVAKRNAEREQASTVWQQARTLEVPIFDGPADEPPTGELEPEPGPSRHELDMQAQEAKRQAAQARYDAALKRYLARVEELQKQGGDMWASGEFQKALAEFNEAVAAYQRELGA